jgi:hypothetical protein
MVVEASVVDSSSPVRTALDLLMRARKEGDHAQRRRLVMRAEWALHEARQQLDDQDRALPVLVAQPGALTMMRRYVEERRHRVALIAVELRTLCAG